MKLIINYDFFKKINDINNSESKLTLVKSRTKSFIKFDLPFFMLLSILFKDTLLETMSIISIDYLMSLALLNNKKINKTHSLILQKDLNKSKYQLIKLVGNLNDLNVSTDYDLLLQSELYYKETKVVLNDYHLPDLMQKKYINVPVYDTTGDIKTVSIEQEHIIGSKQYVLTLGSPNQVHSLAPQAM